MKRKNTRYLMLVTALLASSAWANGWSDLQSALQRLQGTDPIRAQLATEVWSTTGEGNDKVETHAQASVAINDNENGFQILYGKPLLSLMDQEQQAAAEDPSATTPTLEAVTALNPTELRSMLSAATELQHQLEDAEFIHEEATTYQDQPARVLTFTKGLDDLPEEERKHVKEFESTIKVWTSDNGTPLASQSRMQVKGRFMVVIKFEFTEGVNNVYAIEGDRLMVVQRESTNQSSGAGEVEDTRNIKKLTVL